MKRLVALLLALLAACGSEEKPKPAAPALQLNTAAVEIRDV